MKITDAVSGVLLMGLGLFMLWQASQFPTFGSQPYGAALLPSILAGGFLLGGGLLILRDMLARRHAAAGPWVTLVPELRQGTGMAALLAVLGTVLGQILLGPLLGYLPVSVSCLVVLFAVLRLRLLTALALAIGTSAVCWWLFAGLLRVPLPRGLLDGVLCDMTYVDTLMQATMLVLDPHVLLTALLAGAFGMFVGAMPGLTATMAVALLVPMTFFMDPIPALAAIVSASGMAIFAGDIPGALLRIPGTPASAAYVEDSYRLAMKGQINMALGTNLLVSCIGGLVGVFVLIAVAPLLAEFALRFTSYEYFWLAALGLSCAIFIASADPLKAGIALLIGLALATVGLDPTTGVPRFTLDQVDLMAGVEFIPAMIGLFALAEVMRGVIRLNHKAPAPRMPQGEGALFKGVGGVILRHPKNIVRGSLMGTLIGALPGAGADIAAWMAYAVSKRFSKTPERYGTGHVEGLVDASAANNAAVGGAWIPALVFGIPGDSVTAIVIGVLYMKGMNPGPTVFIQNPQLIYAVFMIFILTTLMMVPLGWVAVKVARQALRVPSRVLLPIVLAFCIVGAFAMTNSVFGIVVMLALGLLGWLLEENGFPVAPIILGLVLGGMFERMFMTSMIKSGGDLSAFFDRPIAAGLGICVLLLWGASLLGAWRRRGARREKTEMRKTT